MRPRTPSWIVAWSVLALALWILTLVVAGPGRLVLIIGGAAATGLALWPDKKAGDPW